MKPYQFSLIRYVHEPSGQEFANIGVLLWTPRDKKLHFELTDRYTRLSAFFTRFDGVAYRQLIRLLRVRLQEYSKAAEGEFSDIIGRLFPNDASSFRTSEIMAGIAADPEQRLRDLFEELVQHNDPHAGRVRNDEVEIWGKVERSLARHHLENRLHPRLIATPHYEWKFKASWQNGTTQLLEPISFDYLSSREVIEKANTWKGRLMTLSSESDFRLSAVVEGPSSANLRPAYEDALAILRGAPRIRTIVRDEREMDAFLTEVEKELAQGR